MKKKRFLSAILAVAMAGSLTTTTIPLTGTESILSVQAVSSAITINTQPTNYVGELGSKAKFTVSASGEGLTYQWQTLGAGKTAWTTPTSSSSKTATYSFNFLEGHIGMKVRCVITDSSGNTITTDEAECRLPGEEVSSITINTQPTDYVGELGSKAKFTVDASGEGLTYQWQTLGAGKTVWTTPTSSSSKTATYSFNFLEGHIGMKVRCVITDSSGNTITTDEAECRLPGEEVSGITINTQPTDYVGELGSKAKFTVDASGEGLTYQWQTLGAGKTVWTIPTSSSSKTATYSFNFLEGHIGMKVRCVITDSNGNTVTTDEAECRLPEAEISGITINSQPTDYIGELGSKVKFTVDASGEGLTYQWETMGAGKTDWTAATSSSSKTATYSFNFLAGHIGMKVRCVITDSNGNSVTTDEAMCRTPLAITSHPTDQTTDENVPVTFTIEAEGSNLTYHWQLSTDGENWSDYEDTDIPELTLTPDRSMNGNLIRCIVSDATGTSVISEAATLTVNYEDGELYGMCGDNAGWWLEEDGTLHINGYGEMYSYADAEESPFTSLENVQRVIVEDGVTVVGAHAFEGMNISSAYLSESVFSLRAGAFAGNDGIEVTIENIGCAIYNDSLPENATLFGYPYSSVYDAAINNGLTFAELEESGFYSESNHINLTPDETYQLEITGRNVRYFSYNSDVAAIDENGTIYAGEEGSTQIVVFDATGKTSVYYIEVSSWNAEPLTWRYYVTQPGNRQWVAGYGDRVSMNGDVAWTEGEDAVAAGGFGTAPIISADGTGKSYVFYYTVDADIRPIKADVQYSEEVSEITEDWEKQYNQPYYALTADEDTQVTLTAWGDVSLDAFVYRSIGDSWTDADWYDDVDLTFDMAAGETVYIQVLPTNNESGTFYMNASFNNRDYPTFDDDAEYTIVPGKDGDITTVIFTAPEDAEYLMESFSNKGYHYIYYNELFPEEEVCPGSDVWVYDRVQASYFVLPMTAGQTVYMRYWFIEDTEEDDYINFRIKKLPNNRVYANVNETNSISIDPDDNMLVEFNVEEPGEYYYYGEGVWHNVVVFDEYWNEVTSAWDNAERCALSWTVTEPQTYHVRLYPTSQSRVGNVDVTISKDVDEEIVLGETYSVELDPKNHTWYTYTAEKTGTYVFAAEGWQFVNEEQQNAQFNLLRYAENREYMEDFWGLCTPSKTYIDLEEGQTIMLRLEQSDFWIDSHVEFTLTAADEDEIAAEQDVIYTGHNSLSSYILYAFTAPEEGYYMLSTTNTVGFLEEFAYNIWVYEADKLTEKQYWTTDSYANLGYDLQAGETIYVKILPNEEWVEAVDFQIVFRNTNQPEDTELLTDETAWGYNEIPDEENPAIYDVNFYGTNGFTAHVTQPGAESYYTQIYYGNLALYEEGIYKLKFTVSADVDDFFTVMLQMAHSPYDTWGATGIFTTSEPQTYTFYINTSTDGLAKLLFDGFQPGTYEISDISLTRVSGSDFSDNENGNYNGFVTNDNPVWIPIWVTNDLLENVQDIYEVVNQNGANVTIEMYQDDMETPRGNFNENGENHWRAYWADPALAYIKISTDNSNAEYFEVSFWKFEKTIEEVNELGERYGEVNPYSQAMYVFTAPETRSYTFDFSSDSWSMNVEYFMNEMQEYLGEYSGYWTNNHTVTIDLNAGDRLWFRITDNQYDYASAFWLNISAENQGAESGELEIYDTLLAQSAEVGDSCLYFVDPSEVIFRIEGMSGVTRMLSIESHEWKDISVWFVNEYGEGECVGNTFNGAEFTYEFGPDFIGDGECVYVKLVTLDGSPIGEVMLTYLYFADEDSDGNVLGTLDSYGDIAVSDTFYTNDTEAWIRINTMLYSPMNVTVYANHEVEVYVVAAYEYPDESPMMKSGTEVTWNYSSTEDYFYLKIVSDEPLGYFTVGYEYEMGF